jgi:type VI secretion system protein ImpL
MRFGLYQGEKYQPVAVSSYNKLLTQYFLPLIQARLEQRMQDEEGKNLSVLYQLLRVYLMLGNPEKINAETITPWIKIDWQNNYRRPIQLKLAKHLADLLALPLPKMTLNVQLIKELRQKLTEIPLAEQIYLRIKTENEANKQYDFRLADTLGKKGSRIFTVKDGSYNLQRIPGLFTYDGFHQIFLDESQQAAKEALAQQWVYGKPNVTDKQVLAKLEKQIFNYYFIDFNEYWDTLIDNLQIRETDSLEQSIAILEAVSGIDSPLDKLVNTIAVQSNLTKIPDEEAAETAELEKGAKAVPNAKMQKLLKVAKAAGEKVQFVKVPGKEIETHFATLAALVAKSTGGSSTMEQIIADLAELNSLMADISNAPNPDKAAAKLLTKSSTGDGNDVIARLQKQANLLPEPIKTWVNILAKGNWSIVLEGVKEQLDTSFQADVSNLCTSSLEGRYPLSKDSEEDVSLQDFAKFFAPQGILEQFFEDNLKALVDTTTPKWTLLPQENQTINVNQAMIDQFQNAAAIRDIFFQGKEPIPLIKFELKPVFLDAKVTKFWLDIEGQTLNYRHGPLQATNLEWPGSRSGSVRFGFDTLEGKSLTHSEEGTWAWFKTLDAIDIQQLSWDKYLLTFDINGFTARYELRANSVLNPFGFNELEKFSCLPKN